MPPANRRQAVLAALQRWNATHQAAQDVDVDAALRVAGQEGLSGRIGDSGHAFGPWQLNDAGGVVTGKLTGTPEQRNAWAWANPGLDVAVSGLARAAGGKHGPAALHDMVYDFERPADPAGEYSRALGGTGGQVGGGAAQPLSAGPAVAAVPDRRAFVTQLLSAISPTGQLGDQGSLVKALQARTLPFAQGAPSTIAALPNAPNVGKNGIAELLREGVGGPTHSTGSHIHAAFNDPQLELAAIQRAQQLGLAVRENPYTDPVDPVHAPHSFHKQNFPGLFNGKTLGRAIDVSGPSQDAFYSWLAGRKR